MLYELIHLFSLCTSLVELSVNGWRICLGCEVFKVFLLLGIGYEIVHCFVGIEYGKPRLPMDILFVIFGNLLLSGTIIPVL